MDENVNNMNMGGNPEPNMTTPNNESSAGPVIGTVIILAVIVLGGLYFWGQRADSEPAMTEEQVQEQVNMIQEQSTSDATADIEADLNATDIDGLDSELNVQ